jgi:hypothetical protein
MKITEEQKLQEIRLVLDHVQEKNLDKVSRKREVVEPRFYICLYLYRVLGLTHYEVAAVFKKDHCTSMYACKQAIKMLENKDRIFIKRCKDEIKKFPLDKFENVKNELGYIVKEVIIDPTAYTKLKLYKVSRSIKDDDAALNMILNSIKI